MLFSFLKKNKLFEVENCALKFSLEWGNNFGKDISERLQNKFPELTNPEIESYQRLCKNIQYDCWGLIDHLNEAITTDELGKRLEEGVFQKYEWINKSNQKALHTQYCYYFWKEGLLN